MILLYLTSRYFWVFVEIHSWSVATFKTNAEKGGTSSEGAFMVFLWDYVAMELTELNRVRNNENSLEIQSATSEKFFEDLSGIDSLLVKLLKSQTVTSEELQNTWQQRAILAEEFVDSLRSNPENSAKRAEAQFVIMVDKSLVFEKAGDHIRSLEDLDAAEVFALNSNLEEMAEPLGKELDEEIRKLGNSSRELLLKLRGIVEFSNRDYLRDLLAEGLDYEDLLGNVYAMIIEEGSDPDVFFKEIGLSD